MSYYFKFGSVFENLQIQTLPLFFERWKKKEWLQGRTSVFKESFFVYVYFIKLIMHLPLQFYLEILNREHSSVGQYMQIEKE